MAGAPSRLAKGRTAVIDDGASPDTGGDACELAPDAGLADASAAEFAAPVARAARVAADAYGGATSGKSML